MAAMTDPRHAYANARLHARFAQRPGAGQWGALAASRTPEHYLDVLRAGHWLRVPEGALVADADARERWLRDAWRQSCAEVAAWYGPAQVPVFEWLAVLADLDALERLRTDPVPPAWTRDDARLAALAQPTPALRAEQLAATPYAPLVDAWRGGGPLVDAWRERWHALRAAADVRAQSVLLELEAAVVAASALGAGARREAIEAAAHRAFRRGAGTVAAAVAHLAVVALQLERVRGGVVARTLEGAAA
jgi:hypothetical protein